MINITLKDGSVKAFESGVTPLAIAESLSAGLARNVLAAELDGKVCDLRTPIVSDCSVELLTFDSPEGKRAYWHTASHILAQAVKHLFPDAVFAIGPSIESGF